MKKDIRMPITKSVIKAARHFGIKVKRLGILNGKMLLQLEKNGVKKWTRGAVTSETKYLAMKIAHYKNFANKILAKEGIPVPKHYSVTNRTELKKALRKIGFPVVIKPVAASQGKLVFCDIDNEKEALKYFEKVREEYKEVAVEEQIEGEDVRILIINNKLVAALKRIPPYVIGDGKRTINQLINLENKRARRNRKDGLKKIKIDDQVRHFLKKQNLTLRSIPKKNEKIFLRRNVNISTGGVGVDVTEEIHPDNVRLAKKCVKILGLDIAGVDMLIPDLRKSVFKQKGKINEVNGGPDAAIHHCPIKGKARYTGEAIVKMLFPKAREKKK